MDDGSLAPTDYAALFRTLTRRYGDLKPEALIKVLCPLHVKMNSVDRTVFRLDDQNHWRASFDILLTPDNEEIIVVGRTGKFVPAAHVEAGAPWKEIVKGRIIEVDTVHGLAKGEIYVGSKKADLVAALKLLDEGDYLEIDQYGAAAKVLSALAESELAENLRELGFQVRRMPEDRAKHLGIYPNYDFEVSRDGVTRKIEVKSLWGTDTSFARLIHSTGRDYPTSSCKFETQDYFAVSLFLRTGNLGDFAFARSVSSADDPDGLPPAGKYPAHVNQNPRCTVDNKTWFSSLEDVWP